ncbi:GNAT family N-acetyltransferase [Halobacteriales archaeon SW_6_65_46]|nr:MAG: GNAT family N-acetyltransferase [Halobacteriales archaeon SW_6_65_46]
MSLFPETLESDRLRYEALRPETFDPLEFYEHVSEDAPAIDEITRYVAWDPHETPKESAEFIEMAGEQFANDTASQYALYATEGDLAGEFVGMGGLSVDWDRELGTLGTWLRKPAWGRGYSGERAARLIELAFDRLDLAMVAVEHLPENEQSERAIGKYVERFGGRREGLLRQHATGPEGEGYDMVRYTISREEFEANR